DPVPLQHEAIGDGADAVRAGLRRDLPLLCRPGDGPAAGAVYLVDLSALREERAGPAVSQRSHPPAVGPEATGGLGPLVRRGSQPDLERELFDAGPGDL